MARYEERYRLSAGAVLLIVAALAAGLVFLAQSAVIFLPIGIVLAAAIAQGAGVIDRARRTIAFRADHSGITLGAVPDKLTVRRGLPLFIPWEEVENIVLYCSIAQRQGKTVPVPCIGIQRRVGAAPLSWGNEQAPGCPVPGVAAWATRKITGWRLDPVRLAAITAAEAPGVRVLDLSTEDRAAGTSAAAGEQ